MADLLADLLRVNLALAVAVAGVMAARLPVRRLFGARIAYGLWILPPLAALAMLVPARVVTVAVPALAVEMETATTMAILPTPVAALDPRPLLAALWLAGVVASLAWLAFRQVQFARAARAGRAGPAVVGVLRPRVVTPADFDQRYTPREREIVLAHEQAHLDRRDPPVNAAVALLVCLNWFNPAVHVMSRWLRIDQELACDARVVAAHPRARRVYAEAMLKTQLAARPLPLGCHWATHPLAQRVKLLSSPTPSPARSRAGALLTASLAFAGAIGGWALRPAQVVMATPEPPPAVTRIAFLAPPPSAPHAPAPPQAPRAPDAPARRAVFVAEPALAQVEVPEVIAPSLPVPSRPGRIVHAVAERSFVEPGSAVRVVASGLAPDGPPLWADFTAFGSQRFYRKGAYERGGSRFSLFTSVVQQGERLRVSVSLGRAFRPDLTGSIDLAPGETGVLRLPTGHPVVVTATVRPETADEIEEGRRLTELAANLTPHWG